jgi:gliding-associated putative ABC transporter substrate-binding component GldG
MAAGKFRHGSNFLITAIAVFVILVVVNFFSYRYFVRLDLTENKQYTISQTTRDLLAGLENIVNVKVYLSDKLPAQLQLFEQQLRDVLEEYDTYGRGKLRIEFPEPPTEPQEQQQLMMIGVRPQPVAVFTRDQSTQAQVYNSIVVQFEEKVEVIRNLLEAVGGGRAGLIGDFEYLLTSKIFKVQRTGRQTVGWFTNDPDLNLEEDFAGVREMLKREWEVRDVRLDPPRKIPFDIGVLVVVAPQDLTDEQLFEIDQFLMRGGKLLAMVDTYTRSTRDGGINALVARPTNFTRLLARYGVKVKDEIVFDPVYRGQAPVSRIMMIPYPFWVAVPRQGLSKESPTVSRLTKLILPWTQPLDAVTSMPQGVKFTPLATTSPNAQTRWGKRVVPDVRTPSREQSVKPMKETVIAMLSGTFPSYFPEGTPYPRDEKSTAPQTGRTQESERQYVSADTHILVVGNSFFLQNAFLQMMSHPFNRPDNLLFFFNSIEWLALGKGLSQIRAREASTRPIEPKISDARRNAYKWLGTFTMPVLVIVGGILYNTIRRRRRRWIADRLLNG